MLAVKLVILIAKIHVATVFAQNSVRLQVIPGIEPGICASQEDRDAARQNLHSAASSVIQPFVNKNNTVSARCGPGHWYHVVYFNMSDPTQQCPPSLRLYSANGVRACGRPSNAGRYSCSSLTFASGDSRQYSKVCGQVIGYQIGSTDVFNNQQHSIDTGYVDGVSITYGSSPRTHIWTYAAGLSEQLIDSNKVNSCPCVVAGSSFTPQTPPSFIGNNYYCESGNPSSTFESTNVLSDPLWDGQQREGQCCSNGRTPPWFSVTLANPTTDDIEVRICGSDNAIFKDSPISLMELYMQ